MVNIVTRMRSLRSKLLSIRIGPGAAILPPEVSRIHMEFALKKEDGHGGAESFWRQCLPRLKYHNPTIPMTISRSKNQAGPAILTIHFTTPSPSSPSIPNISTNPANPTTTSVVERTAIINMKNHHASHIAQTLLDLTKARVIHATPDEARQIKELKAQEKESERVRVLMADVSARLKREKELLEAARGEVVVDER